MVKFGCEVGLEEELEDTEAEEADLAVDEDRGTSDLGLQNINKR